MKTPILGQSYVARSINAADARMINMYPETIPAPDGSEPAYLNRAPGLRKLSRVGTGPIRGLWQYGNYGYAVSGSRLYRISDFVSYLLFREKEIYFSSIGAAGAFFFTDSIPASAPDLVV